MYVFGLIFLLVAKKQDMKKIKFSLPCMLAIALAVSTTDAEAQATKQAKNTSHRMVAGAMTDTGFLRKNIGDNMLEIRLSEIGRDQTNNDSVRAVAQQMITDHNVILTDLDAIRSAMNLPAVDTTTLNMPVSDNTPIPVFDRTWVTQMLAMHRDKVKELETAIPQLKDNRIRTSAQSALPKIKLHVEMLKRLEARLTNRSD